MKIRSHPIFPGTSVLRVLLSFFLLVTCLVGLVQPAAAQDGPGPEDEPGVVPVEEVSEVILQPILQRTISFPANALNYDKTSTILTQTASGIRWQPNAANPAYLNIPRPVDWNGTSNVKLRLKFTSTTATGGNVDFFIRPRAFDNGDPFVDVAGILSDAIVPITAGNQVREQVFTIPSASFGTKSLWVITIQRHTDNDTYTGDVILNSVSLSYTYNQTAETNIGYPANALNYDRASTIITQYALGLRWQRNFGAGATLTIPRPEDWDGTSNVDLTLYFKPYASGTGNAGFFIRPRGYNPGDTYQDTSSLSPGVLPISPGSPQVRSQTITIPANRFGDKALWVVGIQRYGDPTETYIDDLVLMAVELSYANRPAPALRTRFPANALNWDKTSTILTQAATGILWGSDFHNPAFLIIQKPSEWQEVSSVVLKLYFYPTVPYLGSGKVDFFIRPRAFNPGDLFVDTSSLDGEEVPVTGANIIHVQSFVIPATRFGSKDLWVITLQRGGSNETYLGDVVLVGVSVEYGEKNFLPFIPK